MGFEGRGSRWEMGKGSPQSAPSSRGYRVLERSERIGEKGIQVERVRVERYGREKSVRERGTGDGNGRRGSPLPFHSPDGGY
ncbi:hypothetical protein AKJ61_03655 [candidate division MSBL1 archaeon SCGC-AAA259B11]|uniref:Uncharacterized protein n=1 Tax=candidate division MSBL1 archaeon SCGC-AAA259B11 TaxID=1698260 RepID=A0A133U4E4_9EURY|nr:hypothetical protein AKJ61_03655 [candidate division MSBL1 archaeon SCGC-AAA259B11]